MAASTLRNLNPSQTNVVQSIYNSWSNSPYSNDTSVLYKTIGIATGEGLNRADPLTSNADARGTTAFGPFQLNNSGLGTTLANQTGTPFGSQSLDTQSNFVVNYIGAHGTSPWMSVGDTPGGIDAVMNAGQGTLANSGVTGVGQIAQGPHDNASGGNTGYSVTQNPDGTSSTSSNAVSAVNPDQPLSAPVKLTLQPGVAQAVQDWVTNIETSFGDGLKSAITAAETGVGTYLGGIQNWFLRIAVILLGVVLIAIALVILMWDHGGSKVAGQVTRVAAA